MEPHLGVRVSRPPHGELLHQPPDLLLGGDLLQGQDVPDAALRPRVQQHWVPVCAGDKMEIMMILMNICRIEFFTSLLINYKSRNIPSTLIHKMSVYW